MNSDIIFSPIQIKHFNLKNRIDVAPMTRMSSEKDSIPREDVFEFLKRRAANGAGIVYTEAIDAISVSTYDYKEKAFGTDQNMARITREVTELPIMICGKIYDYESAMDAVKDADIILSGKSMLLNPDWIEDIRMKKTLPLYKSSEANIAYTETPLP